MSRETFFIMLFLLAGACTPPTARFRNDCEYEKAYYGGNKDLCVRAKENMWRAEQSADFDDSWNSGMAAMQEGFKQQEQRRYESIYYRPRVYVEKEVPTYKSTTCVKTGNVVTCN